MPIFIHQNPSLIGWFHNQLRNHKSRKLSKPRDLRLKLADGFVIWQELGNTADDVPVKFQSDTNILPLDLVPSGLCEISR